MLVHLSVDDLKFFARHLPDADHVLALPSIDPEFIGAAAASSGPPPTEMIDLFFVGTQHVANVQALDWFFSRVWPLIAGRGLTLKIAGRIDDLMQQKLPRIHARFREHFVGAVGDLAPYYRAARCVIAPMVSGRGVSIKTIEALALGLPFVGTSKAFRGMPMDVVRATGLQPHDEPQAFADAILAALANGTAAGSQSRAAYDDFFSRQAHFSALDNAVCLALETRGQDRPSS